MDMHFFYQGIKIGLAVAVPIGPIALLCIKKSLQENFSNSFAFALAVGTADALYAILGALSLSTITLFLEKYKLIIELIGIGVIFYLGINAIRNNAPKATIKTYSTKSLVQTYFSTIAITLTSPMTILLFTGIFAGMGNQNLLHGIVPLTVGVFLSTTLWFSSLSLMISYFKTWFNNQHISMINIIAGICIVMFALYRLVVIIS